MSKDVTVHNSRGIGIAGALTILFVLLKVFGKIDWSWWWVFSPLWISAIIGVAIFFVVIVVALLVAWWEVK